MPELLKVSVQVAVAGGTPLSASRSFEVSAYDRISVTIPGAEDVATAPTTEVEVQPASDIKRVAVLAVTSDRYSTKLVYWVAVADDADEKKVALDSAHLLTGGAVALLGAPEKLIFQNRMGNGNDANITILVGRQAT